MGPRGDRGPVGRRESPRRVADRGGSVLVLVLWITITASLHSVGRSAHTRGSPDSTGSILSLQNERDNSEDDECDDKPFGDLHAEPRNSFRPENRRNDRGYQKADREFDEAPPNCSGTYCADADILKAICRVTCGNTTGRYLNQLLYRASYSPE